MASPSLGLSDQLHRALVEYPTEDIGQGLTDHPSRDLITEGIPRRIQDVIGDESLQVKSSVGKGRWTAVPWIAVLDPRESTEIQEGVYVVFLLEPESGRFRLTLNQGVTSLKNEVGTEQARDELLLSANRIQDSLQLNSFSAGPIEFSDASSRNELYGPATIYYKEYSVDKMPSNEELEDDLQSLVQSYRNYISDAHVPVEAGGYWEMVMTKRRLAAQFLENPSEEVFQELVDRDHFWGSMAFAAWPRKLFENTSPEEVADSFRQAVKTGSIQEVLDLYHIGEGKATEILRAIAPDEFAILNKRSRRGMSDLGYALPERDPSDVEYQKFTEKVREAYEKHDLRQLMEEEMEEPIPSDATPLEIADWAFNENFEEEIDLQNIGGTESVTDSDPNYYWITANPSIWQVENISDGRGIFYTAYNVKGNKRRLHEAFNETQQGDRVVFYESTPTKAVVAEGVVTEGLHEENQDGYDEPVEGITIQFKRPISDISWAQLSEVEELQNASPIRNGAQGSLFPLSQKEFEAILALEELGSDVQMGPVDRLSPIPPKPDDADLIKRQIEHAKQLVFHGPPGTGKTYSAQRFARWWLDEQSGTPTQDQLEVVTFHPSFTYEDFIEGLTAEEHDGGVKYRIKDGVFKRLCDRARDAYNEEGTEEKPYVLIIDEINRGNLAQIFGETITLLEPDKRYGEENETATTLPHSKDRFTVPPNVYVIGTMNTADRSIALVDAALRRRFRFISFPPKPKVLYDAYGFSGAKEVQDAAENSNKPVQQLIALSIRGMEKLNESILDSANLGKGKQIGHSYLLNIDNGDTEDEELRSIAEAWKFEILPLLEEYYFSQFDRIQQDLFDGIGGRLFDWDREEIKSFGPEDLANTLIPLTDSSATWVGTSDRQEDTVFTYEYLLEEGVLQNGDELIFDEEKVPSEATRTFDENDPFWLCEVTGNTGQQDHVRWSDNDETYSLTGLAETILGEISDHEGSVRGPDYWRHPRFDDKLLTTIREEHLAGETQTSGSPSEPADK